MRVDEVDAARGPAGRARVRDEEERQQQREPGLPTDVPRDPVPVREPEVPERRRRDDVDLDAGLTQVLDGVAHEHAGHVVGRARVRGREDEDAHQARAGGARRPKTTGTATASTAKT